MSLTYASWFQAFFNRVAAVSTATVNGPGGSVSSYTDPFWLYELPSVIDYAEQRIYREADFLNERVVDRSGILTAGIRSFNLPTTLGNWVLLEYINVTGPSLTGPSPIVPVSRAYIDFAFPYNSSQQGLPQVFAPIQQTQTNFVINLGPTPDQAYTVECIGMQRPTPLSSSNQSTYLSTVLPDLFFTATMIAATGYMRDFGQQSDNPAASVSWETQYQTLLKSARDEEARKLFRSGGWTAQKTAQQTTPQRE